LFLWGEVGRARNQRLIDRLIGKVRVAAGAIPQAVVFVSDGFAAYPKAILKHFYTPLRTRGSAGDRLISRGRTCTLPRSSSHVWAGK